MYFAINYKLKLKDCQVFLWFFFKIILFYFKNLLFNIGTIFWIIGRFALADLSILL